MHARFKPGQRLLENELAKEFGVSRGPVREVLQELEAHGIVRRDANRGTFVVEMRPDEVSDHYLFRYYFEALTTRLAALRRTGEDIIVLQQTSFVMEKFFEQKNVHKFLDADADFHNAVAKATQSPFIISMSATTRWRTRLLMALDKGTNGSDPDFQRTLASHLEICAAIVERSPERAECAMKEHILSIARRLRFGWVDDYRE